MATVNYIANPLYKSKVRPADPETIFVMRSGKIIKVDSHENPIVEIVIQYPIVTETELEAIKTFVRANRLNQVLINAIDGETYVAMFKKRSVMSEHIGGENHKVEVLLLGALPSAPDAIEDMTLANDPPSENRQIVRFTPPVENGQAVAGYLVQHRNKENSDWLEINLNANQNQAELTYAKGTTVLTRMRSYSMIDGNQNPAPFTDLVELLAGGKAFGPTIDVFTLIEGFRVVFGGVITFGYDVLRWNIRYRQRGTANWIPINDIPVEEASRDVPRLRGNTNYEVQASVETVYGDGEWNDTIEVSTLSSGPALGSAANPHVIADSLDYRAINVLPLLNDGIGLANATYFRLDIGAGHGGRYRIKLAVVSPNPHSWIIEEADGSPSSTSQQGLQILPAIRSNVDYDLRLYPLNEASINPRPTSLTLQLTPRAIVAPSNVRNIVLDWFQQTSMRITFDAPLTDGGSEITGYGLQIWVIRDGIYVETDYTIDQGPQTARSFLVTNIPHFGDVPGRNSLTVQIFAYNRYYSSRWVQSGLTRRGRYEYD